MIPRLVIAGTHSGVGKTTLTIALARAFAARGLRVALFKCGPDYLDPTYHARATGEPSHNLDGWMMGRDAVRTTFDYASRGKDVALIEGVMGLFDGASPTGEEGSTAEIAKWLEAPVVLVIDAGGMARSIAAVASGFASFDTKLNLAGVIANRVGSRGHLDLLRRALGAPPIVGGFPRDSEHAFAERHLGLHTADTRTLPDALLDALGEKAAAWLSLDRLLELARSSPGESEVALDATETVARPNRCRIALAKDEAFHFYYADNLRRLEALGAELVPFSPCTQIDLPPGVDGLYLGGGYPEVYAAALSANVCMREAIARFAARGGPIYAECGGLMYLTRAIVQCDGTRHPMVGLVPAEAHMQGKMQALGYVEVETQKRTILGEAGARFRGHQFRYSELRGLPRATFNAELDPEPADIEHVYSIRKRRGGETSAEGYRVGNVLASYVHVHWASNPRVASELVESCARFRKEGGR